MMLTLADTIEALAGSRPAAQAPITGASVDSRQAVAGSLFVAIPGERVDGHDFLSEAFARGAAYALIQRDVEPALKIVDLRPGAAAPVNIDLTPPLCLRVDDSLAALQQIARFWRPKLSLRVIGITGSSSYLGTPIRIVVKSRRED